MERLISHNKVAGIKQTRAAVKARDALVVYIAKDADLHMVSEIASLCEEMNIELVCEYTRKELAKACRIDVPCAAAAVLK